MKRRDFIAGLGGAMAWPLAARAQQSAAPVIGWLTTSVAGLHISGVDAAFRRGLSEVGTTPAKDSPESESQTDRGHARCVR